ncbi:MAG: invasion associated locus B family protein [Alphaproteobacteria bacterium]|nr:invasion associated locus B family protein [Alphaproteobacteria bacterium]MBU0805037.1 invasion associated locus B family protein [Alphaproteobacteria bacterium]MBU0870536.1 invasion associated locus B family protein [Alphaproteobacteria bacterium]MBU1401789.1 invasion associated locus B family protein [Alphaproteobacteria bacterium]MBU1591794.1 invasion associated locus B family protein [Alphaproteobacteria bacterium]
MTRTRIALAFALAAFSVQPVFGQGDPKLNSIVQPIVPDPVVGLPDKAPLPGAEPAAKPQENPVRQAAKPDKSGSKSAGEWKLECLEDAKVRPRCQVIVRALAANQVALVMGVAKVPSADKAAMQIAVPLGLAVGKGVRVELPGYSADFPVSRCTAQGCLVEGDAPEAFTEALKKGGDGAAVIYTTEGNSIRLPLPAKGFGPLFESLASTD